MKKLKLLLFSVLVLTTNSIFAGSRSFDEIRGIANNTLVNSDKVYLVDSKIVNGDTVCYTFKGDNGGYAILSADSRVPALLAYSNDGEIYPELQEMIDFFAQNIDKNQHQNMDLSQSASGSELRATRIKDAPIEPLLKDIAWGQLAPFNLYAPTIGEKQAPVGCLATAVAQLLYYYRYPKATISDIPAYTTATEKIEIAGVKKGTKFDWDNMLDYYLNGYTDVNANAVSNLLSVVDAAVEMDFGKEESGSGKNCAKELVEVFGYDPDLIRISYHSCYTFNEWSQIIYNELKEKRPVLMSGHSMTEGHSFLCDGIDKNGLFHINWGWNGSHDGYYDLAILNPNTTTEAGSSKSPDGYSNNNCIVYGIQPDNGVVDVSDRNSAVDALEVKYQTTDGYCLLFYSYGNNTFEEKKVQLANGYLDEDGNVVRLNIIGEFDLSPLSINYMNQTTALDVSKFKEGKTYDVCLIESEDGEHWRLCEGYEKVNYSFSVKDGVVYASDKHESSAELSASVEMIDFNASDQYAHGSIHFYNSGAKEYYDAVYLFVNSIATIPEYSCFGSFVTVEANDSSETDFKFIPDADSVYYWLVSPNMSVLDSGIVYKQNKNFKLVADIKIDTTATGALICQLTVKNEGDAYYDNLVAVSLNYNEGFFRITPELYLKPGDETVIRTYIPSEYVYTRYSVHDCYSDLVLINDLDGEMTFNDEVSVDFTYSRYNTSDQILVGTLVVNNGTSEPYSGTYILELDTTGNCIGKILASFTVDVPAHSSKNIPLSLEIGKDTCNLLLYKEGSLKRMRYTMYAKYDGKTEMDELVLSDNNKIKIWTKDAMLMVEATDDVELRISTMAGRDLVSRSLRKGDIFQCELPSAVYVVNGKKILVH
ncbi:MAG: C10 family peptidase [Paludibacteraceae bacterium]|nr:C10 family peptidase [Paludibacteraceae bacterium]